MNINSQIDDKKNFDECKEKINACKKMLKLNVKDEVAKMTDDERNKMLVKKLNEFDEEKFKLWTGEGDIKFKINGEETTLKEQFNKKYNPFIQKYSDIVNKRN